MDKKVIKWPKLKGEMSFKAAEGKCLPVFESKGKIVKIGCKKSVKLDCDKLDYNTGNILKRAIVGGDVEICASRGGK